MAEGRIGYEKRDHVGLITISKPETLNSVTVAMLGLLGEAVAEVRRDDDVRCVVLTGEGRGFCSGTDLSGGRAQTGGQERALKQAALDASLSRRRTSWSFTDLPKPTIAAVNGPAVGMGAEFALMCDIRLASEKARLGWVFIDRNLVPDTSAGTFLLPRVVGLARAAELLFTGRIVDAQEAERLGLVNRVVPHDQLMEETWALARSLAAKPPLAARWIKELLYRGLERDIESHGIASGQLLNLLLQSEDHRESVAAFFEKRAPVWKGQ